MCLIASNLTGGKYLIFIWSKFYDRFTYSFLFYYHVYRTLNVKIDCHN